MEFRQGIGLLGIVLAAIAAQLNDAVLDTALSDVAGNIGLSSDTATWLRTLVIIGQVLGMCSSPSLGLGLSFRRFALFAIFMNCVPSLLYGAGRAGRNRGPHPALPGGAGRRLHHPADPDHRAAGRSAADQQNREGVTTLLDVIAAQEGVLRGENTVAQAQADLELRLVDLYRALGGWQSVPEPSRP